MAWTQVDADRIKAAIAQGVLTVEHDGKRVTYRSLSEMRTTLQLIENEIGTAAGTAPVRQYRFVTSKGL